MYITSRKTTVALLKEVPPAGHLRITFHPHMHWKVTRVTELHPMLIQFVTPGIVGVLNNVVAQRKAWKGTPQTQEIILMKMTSDALLEIATAFEGTVKSVEIIATEEKCLVDLIAEYPEVCYDATCFRKTCEELGYANQAQDWILRIGPTESNKNIGWLILHALPKGGKSKTYITFLKKYIECFNEMVEPA